MMKEKEVINLGSVDQVPIGQGFCFIIEGEEIAVFRLRNGEIFAISNQCPHRQGTLSDGIVGDTHVICPMHGREFDLVTGKGSNSEERVKVFKVWEEHGEILMGKQRDNNP